MPVRVANLAASIRSLDSRIQFYFRGWLRAFVEKQMLSGFFTLAEGFEMVSAARNLGLVCLLFFALLFWWAKRNI